MPDPVRPAVAGDQSAVEEVVTAAYLPWTARLGVRPAPMDADYPSLISDGRVYVTGSDTLDGVIVLIPEPDALLVENIAVRPDRQGAGIGRRLLSFAEAEVRRRRLPEVRLYTHARMARNIRWYAAFGYTVTGRRPIDGGHLVHMRKAID